MVLSKHNAELTLPVTVVGSYIPAYDGSDIEPPTAAYFDIVHVWLGGHDITNELLPDEIQFLVDQIISYYED